MIFILWMSLVPEECTRPGIQAKPKTAKQVMIRLIVWVQNERFLQFKKKLYGADINKTQDK